jgi:hypothetical protein
VSSRATPPTLGPTRLHLGWDLSAPVGGAWLPYTAQISDELAGLQTSGYERLGKISSIRVNWRSLAHYPGLDAESAPDELPLMSVCGERASVTLLVIPARTSSTLAAALLRQAGAARDELISEHTAKYREARQILSRAAAQCRDGAATPR